MTQQETPVTPTTPTTPAADDTKTEVKTPETPTGDDSLRKELEALKAKNQELLDETKKAKRKADEESRLKEEARQEKLKKDGDYEQLFKSAEQKARELEERLRSKDEEKANEVAKTEAMKLASQLADGYNAELLQEFLVKRIKYTEDGIRVLDSNGGLTVSSLADLKNEFEKSDKFKALLRGSKATGGGASGTNGGATSASVDRKTFDSWNWQQKAEHLKQKGTVID